MVQKTCLVARIEAGSEMMGTVMFEQVQTLLAAVSNRERVHCQVTQFVLNGNRWMGIRHTGKDKDFEADMANIQCTLMDSMGISFEASDYIAPYGKPRYLISPMGTVTAFVHDNVSLLRQLPYSHQEQIDIVLRNRGHGKVIKSIKNVVMVGEHNAVCNVNRYARYHVGQKLMLTPEILDGMVERKNGFQSDILVITTDNRVMHIAHEPSLPAPATRATYAQRRLGLLLHGYTEVIVQRKSKINDYPPLSKWDHFAAELYQFCNTSDGEAFV